MLGIYAQGGCLVHLGLNPLVHMAKGLLATLMIMLCRHDCARKSCHTYFSTPHGYPIGPTFLFLLLPLGNPSHQEQIVHLVSQHEGVVAPKQGGR